MRKSLLLSVLLLSLLIGNAPLLGIAGPTSPPMEAVLKELQTLVDEQPPGVPRRLWMKLLGEKGIVEAKAGQRAVARSTFQKIFTQIAALVPSQPDPHSDHVSNIIQVFLNLALAQGQAEDVDGQAATLDYVRSLIPVMTDSRWLGLGYDFLLQLKDIPLYQVRPILDAIPDIVYGMNALASDTKEGEVDQNTIIATQNFLVEAYAALGEPEAVLASLRDMPGFTFPTAQTPEPLPISSRLILLARLGEMPMLDRYIEQDFSGVSEQAPWQQATFWKEMMGLVSALIEGGQAEEATRLFDRMLPLVRASPPSAKGEDFLKTLVWQEIANVYAKLGNVEGMHQAEAQAILEHLPHTETILEDAWCYLAEAQLEVGDIEEARQSSLQARDWTLAEIIRAQAEHGDVAGAQRSLARLGQQWVLSKRLQTFSWAIFKTTQYPVYYHAAVRAVTKARVLAGDVQATLEWARKQRHPDLKAFALLGFADGLLAKQQRVP